MTTALNKIEPINYKDEYGGCLSGINLYLDGRVIMRRTNANIPIATLHSVQEETDCLSAYKGQGLHTKVKTTRSYIIQMEKIFMDFYRKKEDAI